MDCGFQAPQELFDAVQEKLQVEAGQVIHRAALVKTAVLEVVEMVRERQEAVLGHAPSSSTTWTGHTSVMTSKNKSKRGYKKPMLQQHLVTEQPSGGVSPAMLGHVLGQYSGLVQSAVCSLVIRAHSLLHHAVCEGVYPTLPHQGHSPRLQLKVWMKFIIPAVRLVPDIEELEEIVVGLSGSIAEVLHQVPPWGDWEGEDERERTVDKLFHMQRDIRNHFRG